jgi:hypothetical protein
MHDRLRMTDFKPTLNEDERAAARALLLALKPFRDVRQAVPLSMSSRS